VLRTVEFYHQQILRRTKIREEWSDRKLPSKFDAVQFRASEAIPQLLLGCGLRSSKLSRSVAP
jgi:hypothetical protein